MAPPHGDHDHDHDVHMMDAAAAAAAEHSNNHLVPVTILTGFLGAGKTTLLNRLLRDETHGYKFAVIENELGDVGIDDQILGKQNKELVQQEVLEVVNGCICCTVRGDLMDALHRLHSKLVGSNGKRPFDAVIIETTGLADPAPVLQTFFIEESIQEKYRLDAVLTVVDAKQILTRLDEAKPPGVANEAVQQVLFADKIFLNKMDLVNDDEIGAVEERLFGLHPTAAVIRCEQGKVPPKELVNLNCFNLDRICEMVPDFLDDEFLEFNEKHDKAVSSVACLVEGELHIDLLSNWISNLIEDMSDRLYRYKGVLAVKGKEEKYVFQGVGMTFHGTFSETMTWEDNEKRVSRFVFIGKDLDAELLKEGFKACEVDQELRFPLGTIVECNVGRWEVGRVIAHWEEGNAYRVCLLGGREVWSPLDLDVMIRKSDWVPPNRHVARSRR